MAYAYPEDEMATNHHDNDSDDNTEPSRMNHVANIGSANCDTEEGMGVIADKYGFFGGPYYTDPEISLSKVDSATIRYREVKWIDMFADWEKWMSKRFDKVKGRCRKGIPSAVRSRAWQYLCGAQVVLENNPGRFEEYLRQTGDPVNIEAIKKDVTRQYPQHEMFTLGGFGREDLLSVLKAYSIHSPAVGYSQAQAPIAGVLLMNMPAEQAFWCFVAICDKYLPGYYDPTMEGFLLDCDIYEGLLKKTSRNIYKHIKKHKIEHYSYMMNWFLCVFCRSLPWDCVLRIWDMFLCEGVKVLFRVSLALMKMALGGKLKQCTNDESTLAQLEKLQKGLLDPDVIIEESLKLPLTERDFEKEHHKRLRKRRRTTAEAAH
ncbi:TBC1 domain family member 10B-like [Gigantopelta aegis]|uniref:TBC1 domain family member 10B-like n=1 Tax=Gigantopelta aegis TaxID=1735272 RepID=UPI001B88B1C6|nr:TBC1 domain family member 10B-like [Gigantopelta aegis]